jgi:hypothetical protein
LRFSNVTNKDPVLQRQAKLFDEVFTFINRFLGKLPVFPFETPQSILSKIRFQLQYNRLRHIPFYLNNYIFYYESNFGKLLDHSAGPLNDLYQNLLLPWKENSNMRNALVEDPINITRLETAEKYLHEHLFEETISRLHNTLHCDELSHNHAKIIASNVHILVASFRLKGSGINAVSKYIQRIFGRSIHSFPFPDNVEKSDRKIYLDSITLEQQLQGLTTIYRHLGNKKIYLFPVQNVNVENEFQEAINATFEHTRFVNPNNPYLANLKAVLPLDPDENFHERYAEFFHAAQLLAITEVTGEHYADAKWRAIRQVRQDLNHLNNILTSHITLNEHSFLYTDNLSKPTFSTNSIESSYVPTSPEALQGLNENVYVMLAGNDGGLGQKIRRNERLFGKAWRNEDIPQFWQYLENIFWEKNKDKSDEIPLAVQHLLQTDQPLRILTAYVGALFHPSNMRNPEHFGYTEFERAFLYQELGRNLNYNCELISKSAQVKNDFLQFLMDLLNELRISTARIKWKKHYENLLTELKDFRNSELHAGIVNTYSYIKMFSTVFETMRELRWQLFKAASAG